MIYACRRAHPRCPSASGALEATLSTTAEVLRGHEVRDIGLGGLYLRGEQNLEAGSACSLLVKPTGQHAGAGFFAAGRVVRSDPGRGAAIAFTGMSLASFDRLDGWLRAQNGSISQVDQS